MLRANRDATRQKDPKGKRGRTTSSEKKYIYTVKNLRNLKKKFKNLIKINVSVKDLHQLRHRN